MNFSLIQLVLLAIVGIAILGPKELYRVAYKLGRWIREVQKISQEFTAELTREAEMIEREEKSAPIPVPQTGQEDPGEMMNLGQSGDYEQAQVRSMQEPRNVIPSSESASQTLPAGIAQTQDTQNDSTYSSNLEVAKD